MVRAIFSSWIYEAAITK